jgi:hypothetical protein
MVIQSDAISLQEELAPAKQAQSSLAYDLEARAVAALAEAHEMPPGDARTEAINKAMVFRNAADFHDVLCGKRSPPAI